MISKVVENKINSYKEITISKHSGSRTIHCINNNDQLYGIQRNLVDNLFSKVALPDNICGFVKKRSYRDFLVPHLWNNNEKRYYLRLDISDFFGSINSAKIHDALDGLIDLDEEKKVKMLKLISEICTLNDILPQGAVTSPAISNIVFKRLDVRIRNYCRKLNVTYTRYADDLLFSTTKEKTLGGYFVKKIVGILKSSGFILNRKKVKRGKFEISLNGFIVGENIRISRKKKRDIAAFFFLYIRGGKPKNIVEILERLNDYDFRFRQKLFTSKNDIINYLAGYRSFIIDWLPQETESNVHKDLKKIIDKIQETLEEIEELE
ncbi:RNA-directed DNA polymerase [Paenibacillus thalictri]|uniref:RNA-directed DNA polymerase n=2 Tax=Paenibacillus thalictri TaxID=2527873 RepID=A0A4Q9DNM1_9BACL|nr:RNA-directed DNA polymerase [Paenibacillus thalictri]